MILAPQTQSAKTLRLGPILALGLPVAVGWLWSLALLLTRSHVVHGYYVTSGLPPGRCYQALLIVFHPTMFWVTFLAIGAGCMAAAAWPPARWGGIKSVLVVAGLWVIPALELARLAVPSLPMTFFEPIGLAFLTGVIVRDFARLKVLSWPSPDPTDRLGRSAVCFLVVLVAMVALGLWWFWQSHQAYRNYQLGYYDFGHFARRVINTWRGYGFLQQTPGLPAFWDHFNPGLAALAPLWGLWPDVHLFFALQAVCVALPAVFVHGIARRLGATPAGAAAWALAYLTWPVVGQLNYNFSYGWHPVSAALPLMLAGAYCLVSRRPIAALLLAVAACSFKEDVLITTIGLAAGLAVLAWRERPRAAAPQPPTFAWLPRPRVTLIAALALVIAAAVILATTDFVRYQTTRANVLGTNIGQILLSPVVRPGVFWPEVFSHRSLIFLLALFLPLGLGNALRGWPIQLALAVPLAALLAWHAVNAKSIAFQYVTCLIVVITWAAMIGARRSAVGRSDPAVAMTTSGTTALATALCMSLVFGALPSTPPTTPFHVGLDRSADWTAHCRRLDRLVASIDRPDAYVIASGRIAAHLLAVRRLEPITDALDRRDLLAREAGPGKTWLDVFEWVLLDRQDMLQLGRETADTVAAMCVDAGFEVRYNADDIILLHRPSNR